jgi:putative tricarboxylic transport membrane protein
MEELVNLFHGFAVVLQPYNIMLMFVGILLGVIIGVLPGLGGANGVAILLPLTFGMSPTSAIIMLSCIFWTATRWRSGDRRAKRSPPPSPRRSWARCSPSS